MDELEFILLNGQVSNERIGNKAENLVTLHGIRHLNVPKTWVIPWDWHQQYKIDVKNVSDRLLFLLESHLDCSKIYAVRSSSNIEDTSFHSFAGLFKSILNVRGCQNLINAIIEVWDSINSENIQPYLEIFSITPEQLNMAVIVQEMVTPVCSGVLFSNNPMTGLNEVVIESVLGEGTKLVQDGVTPERWVSRDNAWIVKPDESHLPIVVAKKLLGDSKKIIKRIKKPIDLEWVWNGQDVYWVQMREITTLRELNVYSNRFSKDMMPGIIHPLIWSINVPLINTVWLGILEEIVGDLQIQANDLAKSFFYRSYFNMSSFGRVFTKVGFPSEGLEMMMGLVPVESGRPLFKPTMKMLPLLPKLFRFIVDKWHFGRRIQSALPVLEKELNNFTPFPDPQVPVNERIVEINHLYEVVQKIVYFNVLTPILATMYARMLQRQLSKVGVDLLEFDLMANLGEINQYQPNIALAKLHQNLKMLVKERDLQSQLDNDEIKLADICEPEFENEIKKFINDFGHLSDNSNNFMAVPWREKPDAVLQMIVDYQEVGRRKESRIRFEDLPVKGIRKMVVRLFYERAREFALYREQISKQYVYGYGLFRPYFFQLAERLVQLNWISSKDDIFYLDWAEIQPASIEGRAEDFKEIIESRKQEMDTYQDVVLPDLIYGDEPPPAYVESKGKLQGTATSQGYFSGAVKVIHGRQDFSKVDPGDIIVIPYSDVGWTPLFARAGAVIAESGGLLSHSSIIAREYQIPAVVSVAGCMKLKDHQLVSVDGFSGEVILLEDN